ncbi:MAG TPA: hypothetical protein VGI59_02610, partial [Candidatus Udaeobacter sp.]
MEQQAYFKGRPPRLETYTTSISKITAPSNQSQELQRFSNRRKENGICEQLLPANRREVSKHSEVLQEVT